MLSQYKMRKGQIAITDLFLAMLVLFAIITVMFTTWNIYSSRLTDAIPRTEIELYTIQFANQLVRSPGVPSNWELNQMARYNVDGSTRALLHLDSIFEEDDDEGMVLDETNFNNDGELLPDYPDNAPILASTSQCRISRCLEFDGTNDYVEIDHHSSLSGLRNFTIEFWMYPTRNQSLVEEHLIHKRNQWYIKIVNGMRPRFLINGVGEFAPAYNFSLNQWYHIALTNEHYIAGFTPTNRMRFYVNGIQIFSTTASGTPMDSSHDVFLGKQHLNQNYFPGRLDELRISNITRTDFTVAPEINAIGLASDDRVISERKLTAFNSLGYDQIREISNLGSYNFYFVLLRGNETITEIGQYPTGQSVKLRRNVVYQNETSTVEVSLWK